MSWYLYQQDEYKLSTIPKRQLSFTRKYYGCYGCNFSLLHFKLGTIVKTLTLDWSTVSTLECIYIFWCGILTCDFLSWLRMLQNWIFKTGSQEISLFLLYNNCSCARQALRQPSGTEHLVHDFLAVWWYRWLPWAPAFSLGVHVLAYFKTMPTQMLKSGYSIQNKLRLHCTCCQKQQDSGRGGGALGCNVVDSLEKGVICIVQTTSERTTGKNERGERQRCLI